MCHLREYLTMILKPLNSLGHGLDPGHYTRRAKAPMVFAVVRSIISISTF